MSSMGSILFPILVCESSHQQFFHNFILILSSFPLFSPTRGNNFQKKIISLLLNYFSTNLSYGYSKHKRIYPWILKLEMGITVENFEKIREKEHSVNKLEAMFFRNLLRKSGRKGKNCGGDDGMRDGLQDMEIRDW